MSCDSFLSLASLLPVVAVKDNRQDLCLQVYSLTFCHWLWGLSLVWVLGDSMTLLLSGTVVFVGIHLHFIAGGASLETTC